MTDPALLRRVTVVVAVFIWGAVGVMLCGPVGSSFVMPGPLTAQHSPLAKDCGNCHAGADGTIKSFGHGLSVTEAALRESRRCEGCHSLGTNPLLPHSLSSAEWHENGFRGVPRTTGGAPLSAGGQIACSTCHREHQGRDFDLTQLDDGPCQACHDHRFASFDTDHPEFDRYPDPQRPRIRFNHRAHREKHYASHDQMFSCDACHEVPAHGGEVILESFEEICTACHQEQIAGAGRTEPGIAFLSVPALDLETLAAAGRSVEAWPAPAAEDFDTATTGFMPILLAGDPRYPDFSQDWPLLVGSDLLDLRGSTFEELAAVERYAGALKRLFADLDRRGKIAFLERSARAMGLPPNSRELRILADTISWEAVRKARRQWFPNLPAELLSADDKSDVRSEAEERLTWGPSGHWYRDDDSLKLFYLPTRHRDEFLREWFDLSGRYPRSAIFAELFSHLATDDGRCTKCHSVESAAESVTVNWKVHPDRSTPFTKFSHRPHLLGGAVCSSCHSLYPSPQPGSVNPGSFEPMSKAACQECHRTDLVGGRCTICHDYHVRDDR